MPQSIRTVGMIGLGVMGNHIGANLLKAKHPVFVWNRTKSKAEEFARRERATLCDTPKQVGESSDFVIVSLTTPGVVSQVIFGKDGLAHGLSRGKIILDTSTIGTESAREIGAKLGKLGIHYLDGPVSGGPLRAKDGTLTIMIGGNKKAFDKCKPVLKSIGKNIVRVGDVGAGQGVKIANQILVGLHVIAACEALYVASRLGVDMNSAIDVVNTSSGASHMFRGIALGMDDGHFDAARSALASNHLAILEKDLSLTLKMASALKLNLRLTSIAHDYYVEAIKLGLENMSPFLIEKISNALNDS